METKLSSKGQVVLPQRIRKQLGLTSGTRLACKVASGSVVLTPKGGVRGRTRLAKEPGTGLFVTLPPPERPLITSADVRAALADFP